MQVFDTDGNNIALASAGTKCFSKTTGWGGNPACLNDGVTGNYGTACSSHSSGQAASNYDMCVFSSPKAIARVVVYPFW